MNKISKAIIEEIERDYLQEKYPAVPLTALARTKWNDKTANGLTQCIVKFLDMSGHQAERINTMGVYRGPKKVRDVDGITRNIGKGRYTKSTGTKGSADISATINGKSVKIEVKIGKDRQSEDQKIYQAAIERAGGLYFIAKNFDDFLEWYDIIQ